MADNPADKDPGEALPADEIFEGLTGGSDPDRLRRLRLALESVRQHATLNEEITQEMDRLGMPLPSDKPKS